jgi:2-oxoglutarate dehydrogenase E1 component
MYQAIARRKGVAEGYLEHLLELGEVTRAEADKLAAERRAKLEAELSLARSDSFVATKDAQSKYWKGFAGGSEADVPRGDTGVERHRLETLLEKLATVPDGFHVHPKLERMLQTRREMARGAKPLDWAAGEALAFATLAVEGKRVRLTGQDTERGTFSHRHAVLHDYVNGSRYEPLAHLSDAQGPVQIANSPLSETGVLGFEYGYSLDFPDALVLWEAQFGDFVNVAQPIIDQFIISAEDKWNRLSGLVLLLPHGFEGQGPEHSSARLERFLTLSAEENIQVVVPSTPAQMFHCLRRQVVRPWRKPLVVMTPKSLLRHPRCTSALDELARGGFQRFLADPKQLDAARVRRVLLCSGKLYYELEEEREKLGANDVALVRLEQLYPLQNEDVDAMLAPYPKSARVVWVQDEPENAGAWRFLYARFGERIAGRALRGIQRAASASPATGSNASHKIEQRAILDAAFAND